MRLFRTSAGRGTLVLCVALALAALLDADGLRKQAQIQPAGVRRNVALRFTAPLVRIGHVLHLTTPRHEIQAAIGRAGEDKVDETVRLGLPPPIGPLPPRTSVKRTTAPPHKAVFSRDHPLRVWVAGDSLAQVPGDALERDGPASLDVVAVESRLSTGLARPDLYNWYARFGQVIRGLRPQVAVLSFGADDAHDLMTGVPRGRSIGRFGSPTWNAEYRRRVEGVTRELNGAGIRTVWLGLPIPDGPGFRHSFAVVNAILESVARKHSASQYLDTWHLLDSAHGTFTPYLRVHGALTLMRLSDGVHCTPAAGDLIARQLLAELRPAYALR